MTPEELGIMGGTALMSFFGGLLKGKRGNGHETSQTGNGHFREAWARSVDKRLDEVAGQLKDMNQNITDLRIDLGAKR
jgi:hypothetical protein